MNEPAKQKPAVPAPGVDVGGYILKAKLGSGGFGTVFVAERGGERLAVKLIPLAGLGRWGVREVVVLSQVKHPNAARLRGCFEWPHAAPEHLVVMMDYVEGRRLDVWAQEENPSARQVVRRMLGVARALAAVHAARALHRDVKEANIVVREADGEAVLVDFGVGTYEDTPQSPRVLPPGTRNYLSPEAWRFFRENAGTLAGGYVSTPADDMYALGVTFYWLLTDVRPFQTETPSGIDAVIAEAPTPPHERNPRVPGALGALCLRLLAKSPEERPDAAAVCAALAELLAREEAAWEEPLCDAFSGHNVTTESGEDCDDLARWLRGKRYAEARPRRGPRPFQPVEVPSSEAELPAAEPPAPPPEPDAAPAAPTPAPSSPTPASAPVVSSRARAALWLGFAVALILAVLLTAGARSVFEVSPPAQRVSAPGQEVAPSPKAPESDNAAAPPQAAPTPAAVASRAMPPKETASVKTPKKAGAPQQSTGLGSVGKTVGAAVAACSLATGCPGPQVRPTPPSEPCPPGALKAMDELDIDVWDEGGGTFFLVVGEKDAQVTTVTEGMVNVRLYTDVGNLPQQSILSGRLIFGERVYGRLTRARSKDGKINVPVCLELWDHSERGRGLIYEGTPGPNTAQVFSSFGVRPVKEFE